ncbi:MAG: hypothetical protein PUA85_04365 [Oscillospiraceae bacterium]|nr:hypothetical protein [Oscillospiraceae bacterium]
MSCIILDVLMISLALVGIVSIIKAIILRIFSPKDDMSVVIVSPMSKNFENAEFILRSWGEKTKWSREHSRMKIICLDAGLDESTRRICEAVAEEYDNIDIMTPDNLKAELKID